MTNTTELDRQATETAARYTSELAWPSVIADDACYNDTEPDILPS